MSAPRRNLELKAVDPDPQATLDAALALGAHDEGVLFQRDTYFHAVQGRLKLREARVGGTEFAELIAYARADRTEPRVSSYRVVAVADHIALADALADALGVRAVVEKQRRVLLYQSVRIHLDRIAGLGDFVELEALVTGPGGPAAERPKLAELQRALGVTDDRLVARSYADLLERRGMAVPRR